MGKSKKKNSIVCWPSLNARMGKLSVIVTSIEPLTAMSLEQNRVFDSL